MKKLTFLSFLGLLFLVGCANNTQRVGSKNINTGGSDSLLEGTIQSNTMNTGNTYTHIYEDLRIKITTSPLYTEDALKRDENLIYNEQSPAIGRDYMEVFFKDPKVSFEDEIRKNHLFPGCTIQTGTIENMNGLFSSMKGFNIVYIASKDGNLASNGEVFDKQFPENSFSIAFVMDPKRPDKYYKFSYGDCAPGPCSIFGKIEFF